MNNFNIMEYLILAGYSEEKAKELIKISYECGVSLITSLHPYNNTSELEDVLRKINTFAH